MDLTGNKGDMIGFDFKTLGINQNYTKISLFRQTLARYFYNKSYG